MQKNKASDSRIEFAINIAGQIAAGRIKNPDYKTVSKLSIAAALLNPNEKVVYPLIGAQGLYCGFGRNRYGVPWTMLRFSEADMKSIDSISKKKGGGHADK